MDTSVMGAKPIACPELGRTSGAAVLLLSQEHRRQPGSRTGFTAERLGDDHDLVARHSARSRRQDAGLIPGKTACFAMVAPITGPSASGRNSSAKLVRLCLLQ